MSSISEFLLWLGVIFPLVFSAGPGNILCAICGASNGFGKSVPFILGLNIIYTLYALIMGFGMASINLEYPQFFRLLQIAGVMYIAWLGIKFFSKKGMNKTGTVEQLTFMDGVISQALNVKGMTIVLTMYSQFLDADKSLYTEVFTLSFALLMINLFTHFTWAYGGAWMASVFASDRAIRIQNKVFGSMLLAVAFWLFYQAFIGRQ